MRTTWLELDDLIHALREHGGVTSARELARMDPSLFWSTCWHARDNMYDGSGGMDEWLKIEGCLKKKKKKRAPSSKQKRHPDGRWMKRILQ